MNNEKIIVPLELKGEYRERYVALHQIVEEQCHKKLRKPLSALHKNYKPPKESVLDDIQACNQEWQH
jgi:hypothetical protein